MEYTTPIAATLHPLCLRLNDEFYEALAEALPRYGVTNQQEWDAFAAYCGFPI